MNGEKLNFHAVEKALREQIWEIAEILKQVKRRVGDADWDGWKGNEIAAFVKPLIEPPDIEEDYLPLKFEIQMEVLNPDEDDELTIRTFTGRYKPREQEG